jgi:hypothetical protein
MLIVQEYFNGFFIAYNIRYFLKLELVLSAFTSDFFT